MLLNLGDVISKATHFTGRSDFSTSEVSFYANLALTELQSRLHFKPKEATALSNLTGGGDERRMALPSDFDGIIALKYYSSDTDPDSGENRIGSASADGLEIDLDIVDTTFLDSFSSTTGTPARYCLYGGYVELDPIPDSRGSLIMRYLAKQATLVLSTSTPDLDERWHPGWLWKTTELVALARSDRAVASEFGNRYVNYMLSTPNDRSMEQGAKKGLGLWPRRS